MVACPKSVKQCTVLKFDNILGFSHLIRNEKAQHNAKKAHPMQSKSIVFIPGFNLVIT